MRLFIAEKPSMAREIAGCLGTGKNNEGYIQIGDDIVTWCIGHILEQAEPERYDAKYKNWNVKNLPLLPVEWKLEVTPKFKKQYNIVRDLIKKADEIVNAGDPDREGQLLVDEVLEYVGNKKMVKRILLNALDEDSIKKALANLRDNNDFIGLKNSALSRSRADWLIGMNFTRLFTLISRNNGSSGVFSVGRVQTPTLMLIAKREAEIAAFKPQKYYSLKAIFELVKGERESAIEKFDVSAMWKPSVRVKMVDGKIFEEEEITKVVDKLESYSRKERAIIKDYQKTTKKVPPPLPYSLSKLQIDAGKKFGYSPKKVLEIMQKLYEKKYTSYPRSHCEYLPESQHSEARIILKKFNIEGINLSLKSRAWNDKKVVDHNAIIPTKVEAQGLSSEEQNLYDLVLKRYILQFFPDYVYEHTELEIFYANEDFIATGNILKEKGWKAFCEDKEDDVKESILPAVDINDGGSYVRSEAISKVTIKPEVYTEPNLLKAMTEAHKYVENHALKERLKNADGIGTEATRANIIQSLLDREYVTKEGKILALTEKAKLLLNLIPKKFNIEMTAVWESELNNISESNGSIDAFMLTQEDFIKEICDLYRVDAEVKGDICPECNAGIMVERPSKFGGGTYKACNNYPACKYIEGKEQKQKVTDGEKCPECKIGIMIERPSKFGGGTYKACNNYPKCKFIEGKEKKIKSTEGEKCPECKVGVIEEKSGKFGKFKACNNYPKCKHIVGKEKKVKG